MIFTRLASIAALLAVQSAAQTTPVANPTAAVTGAATDADLENAISFLLPSASISSISPSQSSAIIADVSSFVESYTAAHPISSLEVNLFLNQLGATTTPSPAQQSSLEALFNNAEQDILSNPSSFVGAITSLVSPFPFASLIYSYENGVIDGLRTVVASDVGVTVQSVQSTTTSSALAPKATGLAVGAVAAAAGLVGLALL